MLKKSRKILFWILLIVMMAGLLWAGRDILGEADGAATAASDSQFQFEESAGQAVLDTKAVKPKAKTSKVASLKKKIAQLDNAYRAKLSAAKSEIASSGVVSEGTRSAGLKLAQDYKITNDGLAAWYEEQGLRSRADVYRATGESRIASAEMAFNKIDGGKVDAANAKQDALRKAMSTYFADAKNDLTDAERAQIKTSLVPRLQQISGNLTQLVQTVISLLSQVQSSASPAAMAGCAAKQLASSSDPSDIAGSLLMPLKSLLSLVKGMASNVQGMMTDVNAL
jgi:hypothetical protein